MEKGGERRGGEREGDNVDAMPRGEWGGGAGKRRGDYRRRWEREGKGRDGRGRRCISKQ